MRNRVLTVRAIWDPDASVWVATSEDIPGLATEAPTVEALTEKLKVMIPELLDANGIGDGDEVPFQLHSTRTVITSRHAA
jgi:predicted RNase H-like HicB family nuclease